MQGLMVNQVLFGREKINQNYQGGSVFQKFVDIFMLRTFLGETITSLYKAREIFLSLIPRFDTCILCFITFLLILRFLGFVSSFIL